MPKHKKNAELGTKETAYQEKILMEQEDVQSFKDNEEVAIKPRAYTSRELTIISGYLDGLGQCVHAC